MLAAGDDLHAVSRLQADLGGPQDRHPHRRHDQRLQPVSVELAGSGVAKPAVEGSRARSTSSPVGVGRTGRATTVTITNPARRPSADFRASPSSADFLVVNNCPATIAAAASCNVLVSFTPKSLGAKRGVLALSVTGGDAVGVPLSGTGVAAAALVLGPERPSFVPVPVGTASPQLALTVRNDGQEEIEGLKLESPDAKFSLSHDCGMRLAANGSCTFTVVFTPSAEGAAMATIKVSGTVRGTAITPAETVVSGTGVRRPTITITPAERNFGTLTVGHDQRGHHLHHHQHRRRGQRPAAGDDPERRLQDRSRHRLLPGPLAGRRRAPAPSR